MKKIVMLAMGLVLGSSALAQDKIETTISSDFVSSYIWRGQDLGSVAVQPTLGVEYKGLSLTAWGSYGLVDKDDAKEFDLTLAYTIGGFNIGVTDYWLSEGLDPDSRYFKYDAHGTNHVFEANIGYDFGFASIQYQCPISSCWSRMDCHGGRRSLCHRLLWNQRFCRYQPIVKGHEGHQGDRTVLHPRLRSGDRQSLLAQGLSGFRFHIAAIIFISCFF